MGSRGGLSVGNNKIFLFWRWLLIKGKSRLVSSCPPVCPALAVCFPIVSALFLRFRCPMFSVVRPILACLPSLCFSAARPFSFCPPSLSLLSRPASSAQRFPSVSISQDFHTASTAPVCPLASIAPGSPLLSIARSYPPSSIAQGSPLLSIAQSYPPTLGFIQ